MNYKIKRTNRKTLAISIVDGEVIVRSPHLVPVDIIEGFLESKRDWIEGKLKSYRPVGLDLTQDTLRYLGRDIKIKRHISSKFFVDIAQDMNIYVPKGMSDELIIKKTEAYLKSILEKYIESRIIYYAKFLQIKIPPFKIRRYKRIHGRCSSKHELAFNLYLYHENLDFIDYVVLHECAHILEFNHSSRFYDIIYKHMPNYKEIIHLNKA